MGVEASTLSYEPSADETNSTTNTSATLSSGLNATDVQATTISPRSPRANTSQSTSLSAMDDSASHSPTVTVQTLIGTVHGAAGVGKTTLLRRLRGEDIATTMTQKKSSSSSQSNSTPRPPRRSLMALIPWGTGLNLNVLNEQRQGRTARMMDRLQPQRVQLHISERQEDDPIPSLLPSSSTSSTPRSSKSTPRRRKGPSSAAQFPHFLIFVVDRRSSSSLEYVRHFLEQLRDQGRDSKNDKEEREESRSLCSTHCISVAVLFNHYDFESQRAVVEVKRDDGTKEEQIQKDNQQGDEGYEGNTQKQTGGNSGPVERVEKETKEDEDEQKKDESAEKSSEDDASNNSGMIRKEKKEEAKGRSCSSTWITMDQIHEMIEKFTDSFNPKLDCFHFNFKAMDACLLNGYGMQALNSFFVLPYLEFQRQEMEKELNYISKTLTTVKGISLEAEKGGNDGWGQKWISFTDMLEKERMSEESVDETSSKGPLESISSKELVKQNKASTVSTPTKRTGSAENTSLHEEESEEYIQQKRQEGRRTIMPKEQVNRRVKDDTTHSEGSGGEDFKRHHMRPKGRQGKGTKNDKTNENRDSKKTSLRAKKSRDPMTIPKFNDPKLALEAFLASDDESDSEFVIGSIRKSGEYRNTNVLDSDVDDESSATSESSRSVEQVQSSPNGSVISRSREQVTREEHVDSNYNNVKEESSEVQVTELKGSQNDVICDEREGTSKVAEKSDASNDSSDEQESYTIGNPSPSMDNTKEESQESCDTSEPNITEEQSINLHQPLDDGVKERIECIEEKNAVDLNSDRRGKNIAGEGNVKVEISKKGSIPDADIQRSKEGGGNGIVADIEDNDGNSNVEITENSSISDFESETISKVSEPPILVKGSGKYDSSDDDEYMVNNIPSIERGEKVTNYRKGISKSALMDSGRKDVTGKQGVLEQKSVSESNLTVSQAALSAIETARQEAELMLKRKKKTSSEKKSKKEKKDKKKDSKLKKKKKAKNRDATLEN